MNGRRCSPRAWRGGTRRRARRGSTRGQATVEFAFVLPLVVLALLAVVQVGVVVRDQLGVVHAAREAARAASVDPDPGRAVRAAHRTLPFGTAVLLMRAAPPIDLTMTPWTRRKDAKVLAADRLLVEEAIHRAHATQT